MMSLKQYMRVILGLGVNAVFGPVVSQRQVSTRVIAIVDCATGRGSLLAPSVLYFCKYYARLISAWCQKWNGLPSGSKMRTRV